MPDLAVLRVTWSEFPVDCPPPTWQTWADMGRHVVTRAVHQPVHALSTTGIAPTVRLAAYLWRQAKGLRRGRGVAGKLHGSDQILQDFEIHRFGKMMIKASSLRELAVLLPDPSQSGPRA